MLRLFSMMLLPLALASCSREEPRPAPSDPIAPALQQLAERVKPGKLGAMIFDLETHEVRGIGVDTPLPMQSVFKLPLGILVLHKADWGELSLDEKVTLTKDQLSVPHSPIAEAFAERQDYTIGELVEAAVAQSDNTAADVLMKRVGGPEVLTAFFKQRGIDDFRVDRYEYELQPQSVGLPEFTGQWIGIDAFSKARERIAPESQKAAMTLYLADPRDRISPRAAVQVLTLLARGQFLSPASTARMMEILRGTTTGPNKLKAGTPAGAILYHKTGGGPTVDRVNSASNDIGIIELPGGRRVAVAVLLSGSELPEAERDKVIADVARLAAGLAAKPNVP